MTRVGVIHTTESDGFDATVRYFRANPGKQPHVLVDPGHGEHDETRIHEFIPYTRPAKALRNQPGGVETNNRAGGVIQVEIIGRAAQVPNYGDPWYRRLAIALRAVGRAADVPPVFPCPFVAYPASYGLRASQRLSMANWATVTGWVGHQHVPENDHGDPGNLSRVIPLMTGDTPMPTTSAAQEAAQRAVNAWLEPVHHIRVDGNWGDKSTTALNHLLDQVIKPLIEDQRARLSSAEGTLDAMRARVADLEAHATNIQAGAGTDSRTIALATIGAETVKWVETVTAQLTRIDP